MENLNEIKYCQDCEAGPCGECMYQKLLTSEEGILLRQNVGVRYGRWRWDDEEAMRKLIPDTDPVLHGLYQAETVALPLVKANQERGFAPFTFDEAKLLYLTNVYHDIHEGYTGDIPVPDKTRESDEEEAAMNVAITARFLGKSMWDPWLKDYKQVLTDFDGGTFIGRAFKCTEQIGYFLTGVRAWSLRHHNALTPEQREKCEAMGREVAPTSAKKLLPYCNEFAFAGRVLDENMEVVNQIS